jgi:hypothetical protein
MGLAVWFREDVQRALQAARVAGQEAQVEMSPGSGPDMAAYWRGYRAALRAIGAAFGLDVAGDAVIIALPAPRSTLHEEKPCELADLAAL